MFGRVEETRSRLRRSRSAVEALPAAGGVEPAAWGPDARGPAEETAGGERCRAVAQQPLLLAGRLMERDVQIERGRDERWLLPGVRSVRRRPAREVDENHRTRCVGPGVVEGRRRCE